MSAGTKFVLIVLAIVMFSIGWHNLSKDVPARGEPCVAQQGVKATADGTPVLCRQDLGGRPAQ